MKVHFDISKIICAVEKANAVVKEDERLSREQIEDVASKVEAACLNMNRSVGVEEKQDMVENEIM